MERRSLAIEVDFHNLSGEYFGQTPPGATPEVFARGIVSTDANEHSVPSFSPDGNEVFWWANRWPGTDNKEWELMSMTMRRENGRWSEGARCRSRMCSRTSAWASLTILASRAVGML